MFVCAALRATPNLDEPTNQISGKVTLAKLTGYPSPIKILRIFKGKKWISQNFQFVLGRQTKLLSEVKQVSEKHAEISFSRAEGFMLKRYWQCQWYETGQRKAGTQSTESLSFGAEITIANTVSLKFVAKDQF